MSFDAIFNELDNQQTRDDKLDLIRSRAEQAARSKGYTEKESIDTFRHIYSSTILAKYYGEWVARGMGVGNEINGERRNIQRRRDGKTFDPMTTVIEDSFKDLYNNEKGFDLSETVQTEEELIKKVSDLIDSGEAMNNPSVIGDSLMQLKEFFTSQFPGGSSAMNLVAGSSSTSNGFDAGSLIRALSGGKSRMSSKQIFSMSAAAFAQEIIKSNRRALENDLLDILTSGNGKNTLPQVGSGNPMASLTNTLGGLIDNLVGSAMSRRKTRVSTTESDRSREAQKNWNPSRSQQQAMLASWAAQGNRNN